MELEITVEGANLKVRVTGELDEATHDQFRTAVEAALDRSRARHVHLDLSGVTFIDSSGLGAIIGRFKRIQRGGGRMLLINPAPGPLKVLEMAGLLKLMEVVRTDAGTAAG